MFRLLWLLTVPFFFTMTPVVSAADDALQPQPWQWLIGQHTNYQHALRDPESSSTPILYTVQHLDNANAEGIVLLSQQAYLFSPDEPLRRRIYQFIPRRQGWVQHIFEIAPELPLTHVHWAAYWRPLHGCSIQWRSQGDHFVGNNNPQDCYFFVEESGERVAVASDISLYPDYFVINDDVQLVSDSGVEASEQSVHTEYQRTTLYDAQISYSAHSNEQWQDAELTAQLHDQGVRVGLVLSESRLELRYQVELQRTLSDLIFRVHDISWGEVAYEEVLASDVEAIEYSSTRLRIRLKPRP